MIIRFLTAAFVALFVLGAVPTGAIAQQNGTSVEATVLDFEDWERTATRAEDALESALASSEAFEELRLQLANWRERFLQAKSTNADRIATLTQQIAVLGEPPENPETEAASLSQRRAELKRALTTARAPVVQAQAAYSRADGLIKEVDQIIRARATKDLFYLGPSPLNPNNWFDGAALVEDGLSKLEEGFWTSAKSVAAVNRAKQRAPLSVLLILVGFVFLLRWRRWAHALERFAASKVSQWGSLLVIAVSLTRIILPYLGVVAFVLALDQSGFFGPRWSAAFDGFLQAVALLLLIAWLGGWMFGGQERRSLLFDLTPEQASNGRHLAIWLGLLTGLQTFLGAVLPYDSWSGAGRAVVHFPLIIGYAIVWFGIGRLMMKHGRVAKEAEDLPEFGYGAKMIRACGRALLVVSVLGVFLASVGYSTLAEALIHPLALSFIIIGIVVVVTSVFSRLFARFSGSGDDVSSSLIPVLFTMTAYVVSLPFLALAWGVRRADLGEMWTRFLEGVKLGDARISPADFLAFALIFIIGYMITRLVQGMLRTSVLPKTKMDIGGQNAVVSGLGYIGIFLAALIAITAAGIDLSSLAIVAGALSVGIGFGLQNIVSNFVAGIILLIERPISEGDWIEVGGQMGYVRDISVRSTRIETFDRTDVIVPNADLVSNQVTNWTHGNSVGRLILPVGVAYSYTDRTEWISDILLEIARKNPMVLLNPEPAVIFQGFGADSLNFEIRAILRDVNFLLTVRSEINHEIAKRFSQEGIEIPFAQRDVWLRNPEALVKPNENGSN